MAEFDTVAPESMRLRRPMNPLGTGGSEAGVSSLQSTIGNAAVARLLQREGAPEEEELQAKHDTALAQREGDEEEEIMAKHDSSVAQREGEEEEEVMAKHDGLAQREGAPEVGLAGGGVSDGLAGRIDAARGSGSPLDDGTKSTMEGALGTPLDGVRVHVGGESDQLNQAITAKAFTTGNDVFVRSDQWAPGSSSTQRLMAHELTHVAQQREGIGGAGSGMSVGAADTAEEHEADGVADAVMQRVAQRHEDDDHA
jgi:Domain of unknown function (DUF4157)